MVSRWLLKTEPSSYSFTQLCADRRAVWDGVKNPQALKHLSQIEKNDELFVYHTGDEKAVVGIARAASAAYVDPQASDPKRLVVDIVPMAALRRPVPLTEIKANPMFAGWELVRLPRLSVMPVSEPMWREVERLARS